MSITKKSILYLIIANIIWGAGFPIAKWTLEVLNPFTFAFIRFFLAALIILPFTYKKLKIDKKDIPLLILISIVSVSIQISLLFFGLQYSPSINAPIILSSGPIVLIIASAFILKDIVKPKVLIGTLVSLLGVLIVIFRPFTVDAGQTDLVLGNVLLLLAMICGVVQAVVYKKLMERNSPLTIVFWSFVIGCIPFVVPIYFFDPGFFTSITHLNFQATAGIFYETIFSSVIAYYFYYYGLKYIKASEVGIFSYVDPLATIFIAIPLLSEKITNLYILGSFLVFLGIFIAEERIHYHPIHLLFRKEKVIPLDAPSTS
jgi:drug/metabolite transporter (DMT)-like permease